MLRHVFAQYERQLHARPLTTKASAAGARRIYFVRLLHGRRVCKFAPQAVTSALISGAGDVICQLVVEANKELDTKRLAIFTGLGGVMVGPALHTWYSLLHRSFPAQTKAGIGKRLLLDQFLFAPIFIPSFLTVLLTCEGVDDPIRQVQAQWSDALVVNWRLWIPVQLVNFAVIKPHFQVLFANGVAVLWNTYLSWASHK